MSMIRHNHVFLREAQVSVRSRLSSELSNDTNGLDVTMNLQRNVIGIRIRVLLILLTRPLECKYSTAVASWMHLRPLL